MRAFFRSSFNKPHSHDVTLTYKPNWIFLNCINWSSGFRLKRAPKFLVGKLFKRSPNAHASVTPRKEVRVTRMIRGMNNSDLR